MADMRQQLREIANEINGAEPLDPLDTKLDESLDTPDEIQEEVEEETAEAPETEQEDGEIRNIVALSERIGWEPSDIYDLEIEMETDQDPVKLGELKDKYTEKLRAESLWIKEKEELTNQVQQMQQGQTTGQQMTEEMTMALGAITAIRQQNDSTDWAELEGEDPGKAALYKQKLNQAYSQAQQQFRQAESQQQQMATQAQQQLLVQSAQKLLQDIPEWNDATVATKEKADLVTTAKTYGFSDNDINGINDPRVIMLLRRLTQLEKQSKDSSEAVKRVQKAPKVLKGAGRKAPNANKTDQLIQRAKTANRSQRGKAEIDAVRSLLGG